MIQYGTICEHYKKYKNCVECRKYIKCPCGRTFYTCSFCKSQLEGKGRCSPCVIFRAGTL